ncbi:MAG: hypothetical protein IJW82_07340 [Clostridia bacterium]|nr:hypothetical protein [Clostridia bacterium]
MKLKKKLIICEILSTITLVLPLMILFVVNKDHYLKNVTPIGLSFTGIICIIIALIMVKDKFNLGDQKILKFLILFIFCYIFEPFLIDLKIISFMAFLGVLINGIIFEWQIKALKKQIELENSAKTISKAIKENNDG